MLTKKKEFLETALKTAKVYIENLPENNVHYWDFDFTDQNKDIRDSSAGSIGAMGFLLLHNALLELDKNEEENYYKEIAVKIGSYNVQTKSKTLTTMEIKLLIINSQTL